MVGEEVGWISISLHIVYLYVQGQVVGGVLAYLKTIGFLHARLVEEARRKSNKGLSTESDDSAPTDDDVPAPTSTPIPTVPNSPTRPSPSVSRPDRLLEIQDLGFGERSFVNPNSPFRGRVVGITSRVQARVTNVAQQVEYNLKGKQCLKCHKRFLNGAFKKSIVVQCVGCKGFVHQKSNKCVVKQTNEDQAFQCNGCLPGPTLPPAHPPAHPSKLTQALVGLSTSHLTIDTLSDFLAKYQLGLKMREEIPGDGNCWWGTCCDLIKLLGLDAPSSPQTLRQKVVDTMATHPNKLDWAQAGFNGNVEDYDHFVQDQAVDGAWTDEVNTRFTQNSFF